MKLKILFAAAAIGSSMLAAPASAMPIDNLTGATPTNVEDAGFVVWIGPGRHHGWYGGRHLGWRHGYGHRAYGWRRGYERW